VRNSLKPRREPYWGAPLDNGAYLGFRKIAAESGSWIARRRDADSGRQTYKALGQATSKFGFESAKRAALVWFRAQEAGVRSDVVSVADACRAYVIDREREKGKSTAHDVEKRFQRTLYSTRLGATPLSKLRTMQIKAWRDELALSKPTANRTMTSLKAALNFAVRNRLVQATAAREWADVRPFSVKERRRDLFLDLAQRRALLNAANGSLRDLVEAAILTGARAGELVNATVSQFDGRTKTATFVGKTGSRQVPLSDAAVSLFIRLAGDRAGEERLLLRDDGRPWAHSDWDKLVRSSAARANLPAGVCLYTLRHSFITQAIADGLTTLDVARLVGTSLVMIDRHYGQFVQSAARERLARVAML